ncbi:hypothetical protein [Streptomyces sp. NPDC059708]|uniref:hypothetical protein n=1 Tax=Streptomyces sp. NPDC059708 TaxID=3346916 RepID=UPI00369EA533
MRTSREDAVRASVTEAVLAVPGVACLRPGLRGLLRPALAPGEAGSAVRVAWAADGTVCGLHVDIVVRAPYQAAAVARAVRDAAVRATARPAAVRVVVTGIV